MRVEFILRHSGTSRGLHPKRKIESRFLRLRYEMTNKKSYGSAGFAGAGVAGAADGDCDGIPGTGTGFST